MGALNGSISFTRFYVEGDLPANFRDDFVDRINTRIFAPIAPEDEDTERMGWCSIEHPLDLDLDAYKVFYNEYLNIGLRIDKWRIPSPILKAHYTEAEREYMAEHNKERLSRDEKVEIKERVEIKLRHRTMPSMKVIDMSWNTHTGMLRFWNQSAKTCELFQAFFEDTFQMRLVPQSPYTDALQFELTDDQVELLSMLEPSVLHNGPTAPTT